MGLTHPMLEYAMMFVANFVLVCLLGLQSKNVNAGNYLAAILTSFGISVSNFLFVKYAAAGDISVFFVCALGGASGIAFSIWLYARLLERRGSSKNVVNVTLNVDAKMLRDFLREEMRPGGELCR